MAALGFLSKNDVDVVAANWDADIKTAQKIVAELGGKSEITKVGHAFITQALGKTKGL